VLGLTSTTVTESRRLSQRLRSPGSSSTTRQTNRRTLPGHPEFIPRLAAESLTRAEVSTGLGGMFELVPKSIRPAPEEIVRRLAPGRVRDPGDGRRHRALDPLLPRDSNPASGRGVARRLCRRKGGWAVVVPLWTEEEGWTDLSLTATVYESPFRVTGLHVHVL